MARRPDPELAKRFEPTLIERGLSKVWPKAAQRLHQGRIRFEMSSAVSRGIGGYIGARRDRAATAEWGAGGGSPNTDIIADLPTLRDRSRDQMRNAPMAVGALNTDVVHVVGTGLSYTPAIDAKRLGISEARGADWMLDTRARFKAWAESADCDLRRQLDFYSLTELAYRSWMESGDCFVLTPVIERNGRDTLALQLLEADRVSTPRGRRDNLELQDGVELDPETGEPVAIHVTKYHPGDFRYGNVQEWRPVRIRGESGRRNVLHLFDALRPGQVRGVPWIAPILEPLKQLGKWTDAELNAAVVSSAFSVFVKMDVDAFKELFDDASASKIVDDAQKWSGTLDTGKAVNLLPGEDISTATPGRPNPEFDPFFQAIVAQFGVALGMPKEVLMMHFQSSYTAARGALLIAWRRFYQRRDKMAKLFCQPVFELWLANEVAAGRIACPGFFASPEIKAAWCSATWTGDGPGSVDPVKEVTAAKMRVDLGISTLQAESIAFDGQDWEGKQRQRAKEVSLQRRDNTLQAPAAATPGEQPAPAREDDDSDDDDETPLPQRRRK